jgi:hypothetical protein
MSSPYTISALGGWPKNAEGEFVNPETHPDYLAWLAAGNTPELESEDAVIERTPSEKLAALGLDVEELKSLLGLQ